MFFKDIALYRITFFYFLTSGVFNYRCYRKRRCNYCYYLLLTLIETIGFLSMTNTKFTHAYSASLKIRGRFNSCHSQMLGQPINSWTSGCGWGGRKLDSIPPPPFLFKFNTTIYSLFLLYTVLQIGIFHN